MQMVTLFTILMIWPITVLEAKLHLLLTFSLIALMMENTLFQIGKCHLILRRGYFGCDRIKKSERIKSNSPANKNGASFFIKRWSRKRENFFISRGIPIYCVEPKNFFMFAVPEPKII